MKGGGIVDGSCMVNVKGTAHATAESFMIWTFALNDGGMYIINEHETIHISFFFSWVNTSSTTVILFTLHR